LSWEIVTDRVKAEAREKELSAEQARITQMIENAPVNIMFADRDLTLRYLNATSIRTFKKLEQYLPVKADQMLGKSIDIFHKNPEHQRRLLADPRNLPHSAVIRVGPEDLDLHAAAILDQNGEDPRPMVTWEYSTEKSLTKEREAEATANTAAVNQLLLALAKGGTSREVITASLTTVREAFGWTYGSYWEVDPKENALRFVNESGTVSE